MGHSYNSLLPYTIMKISLRTMFGKKLQTNIFLIPRYVRNIVSRRLPILNYVADSWMITRVSVYILSWYFCQLSSKSLGLGCESYWLKFSMFIVDIGSVYSLIKKKSPNMTSPKNTALSDSKILHVIITKGYLKEHQNVRCDEICYLV